MVMKKEIICLTGFYCAVLGMLGILALVVAGFLVWELHLTQQFFWALLGGGFVVAFVVAAYCFACDCRKLGKEKKG